MQEIIKLKKSNCKNCYKCIRNCSVKSIRFSGNQAHIIPDECILCGECFVVCPQNAKYIVDDTEKCKVLLAQGRPVVASLAPSFAANYKGAGIAAMTDALKKLGFAAVEETAVGATLVKKEYERILAENKTDILISSCCHTVNLLIQKYFPTALPFLAPAVTPMQAHCADIKRRDPSAATVFIGPCISKKDEIRHGQADTDCVLTFDELSAWLDKEGIKIDTSIKDEEKGGRARFFPTTGGIIKSMDLGQTYEYIAVDGVENCINALKDIINGNLKGCFVEMSACRGGCIAGPVMSKSHSGVVRDTLAINRFAEKKLDFEVEPLPSEKSEITRPALNPNLRVPSEDEIRSVLKEMGKNRPEDELNCGSCGYNTCRDKAVAVIQGKAEVSMCLPYLKDRAESFNDGIVRNTPNGIIVLNDMLEIQQINRPALDIMNLRNASDVLGEPVIRILEPSDFVKVQNSGINITGKRDYLAEYKKYVEKTIVYDKSYHILLCIMRDITDAETEQAKKESMRNSTIEVTDKVIEKQMRVVQEIASLLGETTAETKIALTKLKESLSNE